jgi:hypothetical protein
MKLFSLATMLVFCGFLFAEISGGAAATDNVADDPYAPLRLNNGKWELVSGDKKGPKEIENHCEKTGLFFACEQILDGKTAAFVVFLPYAKTPSGGEDYHTQVLMPDAKPAGEWNKLTIEGDRWLYTWESTETEKKVFWRNVNTFSGADHIHFEIQSSSDGSNWETTQQGDEHRVK